VSSTASTGRFLSLPSQDGVSSTASTGRFLPCRAKTASPVLRLPADSFPCRAKTASPVLRLPADSYPCRAKLVLSRKPLWSFLSVGPRMSRRLPSVAPQLRVGSRFLSLPSRARPFPSNSQESGVLTGPSSMRRVDMGVMGECPRWGN
jgi:hypothetical protein